MKIKLKIFIAVLSFISLILVEIPFAMKTPETVEYVRQIKPFWRFVTVLFLHGGGHTPNVLVILIYLACYKQRHRAALHLLLYMAQLFLVFTLRSIY